MAIVGAGFTGLWAAYYLAQARPDLRIAVLEAETAGFGASGRNGGWCSALYPVSLPTLEREHGRAAAMNQYRAMQQAVDEIERVVGSEKLAADFARGGTITLARSEAQLERASDEVAEFEHFGFAADDLTLLDGTQARERVRATGTLGATFTPHCAAIQPAKLARSLATLVATMGVEIYERTRVTRIEPGRVDTVHGSIRADAIVRATEGYTAQLHGARRILAPVYSLIIATEPLPASMWDEIGLANRETFADFRHLIVYGQRTSDDRLVFGGRGAPYHLGSRIVDRFDRVPAVFESLRAGMVELFPVTASARVTHRWGGPLGIARDWHAAVDFDATTGLGFAGGYVGDGVSTTNLAGRTLRDLVLGHRSELTKLPWVGHRWPEWEPEPLRWLGANAGLQAMRFADAAENRHGKRSKVAAAVNAILKR
ncbi:MAG: dependent oxidoreductase [Frankiales bacterium]|nr:dependent oxidoreductase [Frankiales bacterium]